MEQPHPSDTPAQPHTQDAPAAHPVVHPGERPVRALIAARLSKLQRGGQQGIGIETVRMSVPNGAVATTSTSC